MIVCEVCGNEFRRKTTTCPYCGAAVTSSPESKPDMLHRVVNLEKGLPTVSQALHRLDQELETARLQGYRVLTLIHGYGSSGKGGAIRKTIRKQLDYYNHLHRVNDVIAGENFSSRSGAGRQLLRRFPALSAHSDLNRANPGVTLVVL